MRRIKVARKSDRDHPSQVETAVEESSATATAVAWTPPRWEDVKTDLNAMKHYVKVVDGIDIRDSDAQKVLGTTHHRNFFERYVKKMSQVT